MSGKAKRKGKQSPHSGGAPPGKQRVVLFTNAEELPGQLHQRFAKLEAARQQSSKKQAAREQAQQVQRGKREALLNKKRGNGLAEQPQQEIGGAKAQKGRQRNSKAKKGLAIPVGKGVSIRRPTAAAGRTKRKQKAKKAESLKAAAKQQTWQTG